MEYFFLGLGNPDGYGGTRHNVGKDFLEGLVRQSKSSWNKIGVGRIACVLIAQHVITCAVSDGFMNDTGKDMRELLDEINTSRLVVVHDEIDFPIGVVRLSKGKSAGGHNGVNSIIQTLGTNDFFRLRIGIGRPGRESIHNREEYVLGQIPEEEMRGITKALGTSLPHIFSQLFNAENGKRAIQGISPAQCAL